MTSAPGSDSHGLKKPQHSAITHVIAYEQENPSFSGVSQLDCNIYLLIASKDEYVSYQSRLLGLWPLGLRDGTALTSCKLSGTSCYRNKLEGMDNSLLRGSVSSSISDHTTQALLPSHPLLMFMDFWQYQ